MVVNLVVALFLQAVVQAYVIEAVHGVVAHALIAVELVAYEAGPAQL